MKFELPSWSVRNPLGTIALFISLIYGVCALLLGTSVKSLSEQNQTYLILFIVLFPIAILAVFAWWVAVHHRKLYGPGDYRTDEGFLSATTTPPDRLGGKLREELANVSESDPPSAHAARQSPFETPGEGASSPPRVETNSIAVPDIRRATALNAESFEGLLVARAYMAEGLVFQELQSRLRGTISRSVSLVKDMKRYQLDGIVHTPDGDRVIEVSLLRAGSTTTTRLQRSGALLSELGVDYPSTSIIWALVVDYELSDTTVLLEAARSYVQTLRNVEVVVFMLSALMAKYGFRPTDLAVAEPVPSV